MEYKTVWQQLQKRQFYPVYFLQGEEPYFIDTVVDFIEKNALDESERSFNQTVLYGKEIDFKTVLDQARRYPVMAERQVVLVKEAQELKSLEQLEGYFKAPVSSTVLVLAHKHKSLDKRKKLFKLLSEEDKSGKICLMDSARLYDNQIPGWIEGYLRERKASIAPEAVQLLAESLGNDLSKIANELDKLLLNLPEGKTIDRDLIQKNIGISKEFNVFELQTALTKGETQKVFRIADYFIANPKNNPLPLVLSSLYGYFAKTYALHFLSSGSGDDAAAQALGINKFFVKDYRATAARFSRQKTERILHLLKECDLRSKGVFVENPDDMFNSHVPHGELLRELLALICA